MNTQHMWFRNRGLLLLALCLLGLSPRAQAQWLTQTIALTNGWNAVYLHVDPSYDTLEHQIALDQNNPIQEIWLWAPTLSSMQFILSPQEPLPDNHWAAWFRSASLSSLLQRLVGDAAYLVRVVTNAAPYTYTWKVKGKPIPPNYRWTTTGLNFLGFPTAAAAPPVFDAFLHPSPEPFRAAEIYQYPGGELGTNNPSRMTAPRTTTVQRGKAYWIRSGDYFNRYFGPFELRLSKSEGMNFGSQLGALSFRLRNLTASNLTVTLNLLASESPPSGEQVAIRGVPPLLVRGSLNLTNLTYAYASLTPNASYTWTLPGNNQPGCEMEAVLGLDRSVMTTSPGELLAGILRFRDSLAHTEVDVPVSATAGSSAGLWVGGATVLQVGEYLKSYQRDSDGRLVQDTNGSYIVTGINTNPAAVASPYPLRLVVHNPDSSGNAVLLQRVYCGVDAATNAVVATGESALNRNYLAQARRISATHLPWTPTNTVWAFDGRFGQMNSLNATVTLDYRDHASNPFLHTYHPDHDNVDATFGAVLSQGSESYTVRREITLGITPTADDFNSRTSAGQAFSGTYAETISLLGLARGGANDTRTFQVSGGFSLNRVTSNTNLVFAP